MIFNNRTHRTKINEYFSDRSRIEYGVSKGVSNLGPLLFNTNLSDLFYECEESNIASYAGHTTLYLSKLFHWLQYNHLQANTGKFYLRLSSKILTDISIGDASIKTSIKETLLGILIDSELNFDHI